MPPSPRCPGCGKMPHAGDCADPIVSVRRSELEEKDTEIERLKRQAELVKKGLLDGLANRDEKEDALHAEIERLRKTSKRARYQRNKSGRDQHEGIEALRAEIERLRSEKERLIEQVKLAVWSDSSEECKIVNADNERLRAKLAEAEAFIRSDCSVRDNTPRRARGCGGHKHR